MHSDSTTIPKSKIKQVCNSITQWVKQGKTSRCRCHRVVTMNICMPQSLVWKLRHCVSYTIHGDTQGAVC